MESEPSPESHVPKLPKVLSDCGVNLISPDTCAELIRGEHSRDFDTVLVVDCRFDYEYKGGHIRGSINVSTQEDVERLFFRSPRAFAGSRSAIIFHCEFSKHRGPKTCKWVREHDRKIHGLKHFPQLFYPEMYVMAGGYKSFHMKYSELCEPNGYIPMEDPKFVDAQRHCWKVWKNTKKELSRSRSLSDLRMDDSPVNFAPLSSRSIMYTYPPAKRPLVTSFSMTTLQTPLEPKSQFNFANFRLSPTILPSSQGGKFQDSGFNLVDSQIR